MLTHSGLTGLRPHDVRRSVGSWLAAAGLTSNQVGALLNHKSNVTSKGYVQLGDDEATKAAAEKTQAALVQSHVCAPCACVFVFCCRSIHGNGTPRRGLGLPETVGGENTWGTHVKPKTLANLRSSKKGPRAAIARARAG